MKSSKQVISQTIKKLQNKQRSQYISSSQNNDNFLSPVDLIPIQFTGMIEDYLFRESREIFDILKEDTDQDIEGLTYSQIRSDSVKNAYFDKVRLNIPKYYSLRLSDRQKHFELQGQLYMNKLGITEQDAVQNSLSDHSSKKQNKTHELTPMKCAVSKKQGLFKKKQYKKNIVKIQKVQIKNMAFEACGTNQDPDKKFNTPEKRYNTPEKKSKDCKKVKFFEFQYVKDFSQYKTPKKLANVEQLIEPLKDCESVQKSQE